MKHSIHIPNLISDFEVPNEPTNNLSIQRLIMSTRNNQEQASIIIEEQKPVVLADASPIEPMELDLGEMYDDVLQCVYDDVDVKYDDIQVKKQLFLQIFIEWN